MRIRLHIPTLRAQWAVSEGRKASADAQIYFEPRDMWIGVYWLYSKSIESPYRQLHIYICILPMLPIRVRIDWGW